MTLPPGHPERLLPDDETRRPRRRHDTFEVLTRASAATAWADRAVERAEATRVHVDRRQATPSSPTIDDATLTTLRRLLGPPDTPRW